METAIKKFEVRNLNKFADSLAKKYNITHKEYEGLSFKTKYCYEFRDKSTGKLKGQMEYIIVNPTAYWCNFELEDTMINLKLPENDQYGLSNAIGRHSKSMMR